MEEAANMYRAVIEREPNHLQCLCNFALMDPIFLCWLDFLSLNCRLKVFEVQDIHVGCMPHAESVLGCVRRDARMKTV